MKTLNKWIFIIVCIFVLSSCSKESEETKVDETQEETQEEETQEETQEEAVENNINEEFILEEEIPISKTDLLNDLADNEWVQTDSIYIASDQSFVVYKQWIDEKDTMEYDVFVWDLENEPIVIEEVSGFVQSFDIAPNEEYMIIHVGTSPLTTAFVYNIIENEILVILESVDKAIWSKDSQKIIQRKVTLTDINSVNGYNESLLYWDVTLKEPIVFAEGRYGITFNNMKTSDDEFLATLTYPDQMEIEFNLTYDSIKEGNRVDLDIAFPLSYVRALLNTPNTVPMGSSFVPDFNGEITDEFLIYWDTTRESLISWSMEKGEVELGNNMALCSDFIGSPNQQFLAMTSGTSVVRELIIVDVVGQSIVYREDYVAGKPYWSIDSQYLGYNTLSDIIINPDVEVEVTMDVTVLDMTNLVSEKVALGTDKQYIFIEEFNEKGLDVYESLLNNDITRNYTILYEEIELTISGETIINENIQGEEVKEIFANVEYNLENEYANAIINRGIKKVNDFYLVSGFQTKVLEGYVPLSSTIEEYTHGEDFISLFFTFVYINEKGYEVRLYDSLTYHKSDGVLIDFIRMFKAEENENVFSQLLKDEVEASGQDLIKEFAGYSSDAKFYFVEDGIVVYFDPGVYTKQGDQPLYIKLFWDDLKGIVDTDSLVY